VSTVKVKLDTALKAQPDRALSPFADAFHDSDAFTLLFVGELRTSERTEKVIDGGEAVKVRVITAHPVTGPAAHHLRRATRAAFYARNIRGEMAEGGNLFHDGPVVDLDASAMENLAGLWAWEEFARLRISVGHWLEALRKVGALNPAQTSPDRYRDDILVITEGLEAALAGVPEPDVPDAPEHHALTATVEDVARSAAQVAQDLIEDAEIVCGATLLVTGPGDLGQFVVTCQRDEHPYGEDGDAHAGLGEDGELYTWPNPAPADATDEPQSGGAQ
jgi:hypothetical protein